jgi:hypothetical protein
VGAARGAMLHHKAQPRAASLGAALPT